MNGRAKSKTKPESFETAFFRRLDRIADALESIAEEIHLHAAGSGGDAGDQKKIDEAAARLGTVKDKLDESTTEKE